MTFKQAFGGLIYALLNAGIFGWLWPRYHLKMTGEVGCGGKGVFVAGRKS